MVEIGLVYSVEGPKERLDPANPTHVYWAGYCMVLMRLIASPVEPPRMMGAPPNCSVGVRMVVLCSFGHLSGRDGSETKNMVAPVSWLGAPLRGAPLGDGWLLFRIESRRLNFVINQQVLDDVQVKAYGKVVWKQAIL